MNGFSTWLPVQSWVGTIGPLQLARTTLLFYLWLHTEQWCQLFSFAIILRSHFLDPESIETWRCVATTASCPAFFSTAKSSPKAPLHCRARVRGEIWREGWVFFWVVFILRLWWKTIICVPWAIFPCWPTRQRSVFDMPVVLEKKGRTAGVWVLFSI